MMKQMDFGVATFPTDQTVAPDELARMCEERGFESLFFTEHTHIPASRETPYPAGGELPEEYRRILDPFVALTVAACATKELKVGTGLSLIVERDPICAQKRSRRSTASRAVASCSASVRAGISRRCETTAPIPSGASA